MDVFVPYGVADTCQSASPWHENVIKNIKNPHRNFQSYNFQIWDSRNALYDSFGPLGAVQKENLERAANWHGQELVLSPPAQPQKLHNANYTKTHNSCRVALCFILVMTVTHPDENCYAPHCKLLLFFPCVFQACWMLSLFLPSCYPKEHILTLFPSCPFHSSFIMHLALA